MTLKLISLTKTFSAKAALKLVNLIVEDLNMFFQIAVAVECSRAQLASIRMLMTLSIMLESKRNILDFPSK
jgi:hypothetical protein